MNTNNNIRIKTTHVNANKKKGKDALIIKIYLLIIPAPQILKPTINTQNIFILTDYNPIMNIQTIDSTSQMILRN